MGGRIAAHTRNKRDFRPYDKSHGVTRLIEILAVLVVGQTNCIGANLPDQFGILKILLSCQRAPDTESVLMTGNAAQRGRDTI